VVGHKSPNERFAGAEDTLTIEALMQDGKALQSGTSHFLGQNFAKAFDVQYVNKEGKLEYVWATSWGVSTRLMGALIMAHSDNNGLVLPPKLAPIQVVMIPIYKGDDQLAEIRTRFEAIAAQLKAKGISVKIDDRDNVRSGFKFAEYELKGVPVRLAMGPRDMENGTIELVRRDTLEKQTVSQEGLVERIEGLMTEIQENIYRKALNYRESMITKVDTWEEFKRVLDERGGFTFGALGRHGGDRGGDQGGHEGHDPLHPARRRRRRGRLHLFGQAVAPARALRSELLTGQAGAIDRIECKATAGTIRRRFSNFTYDRYDRTNPRPRTGHLPRHMDRFRSQSGTERRETCRRYLGTQRGHGGRRHPFGVGLRHRSGGAALRARFGQTARRRP